MAEADERITHRVRKITDMLQVSVTKYYIRILIGMYSRQLQESNKKCNILDPNMYEGTLWCLFLLKKKKKDNTKSCWRGNPNCDTWLSSCNPKFHLHRPSCYPER